MLFMQSPGKPVTILWSWEGLTQVDPLAMILYGIALLLLAEKLREAYPDVMQPWYAGDSGLFGTMCTTLSALNCSHSWDLGLATIQSQPSCGTSAQTQKQQWRVRPSGGQAAKCSSCGDSSMLAATLDERTQGLRGYRIKWRDGCMVCGSWQRWQ